MLKFRRILNLSLLVLLPSVIAVMNSGMAEGFSLDFTADKAVIPLESAWYKSILSEPAISLIGQKTIKHGPNCFNSALVGGGVLERVRYTSSTELLTLLKLPICSKVLTGEHKSGDMQVFVRQLNGLDESNSLAHANNWLTKDFAFNKMSLYAGSGYEITTHQAVLDKYQYYSEGIIFNQTQLDGTNVQIHCEHGFRCENKIKYYRCDQSISDYIFENTKSEILLNIYKKIKIIEKDVEQIVFSKDKASQSSIEETKKLKNELLNTNMISKKDSLIAEYLEQSLDSILKQFTY